MLLFKRACGSLFSIKNLQVSSSVSHAHYDNPLTSRYASPEMSGLFGEQRKFGLWRRLWVVLAEAEREMGLAISQEQLDELKANVDNIDFKAAAAYERKLRHDVMAHIHAYGDVCPKARPLARLIAQKLGFEDSYIVTGQTYTRKVDSQIVDSLSGIAQSAHKLATDLRLLASRKEIEEPFEADQIGSSAMAYKRNPMRAERICSIARFAMGQEAVGRQTAATQWLERTLDDSAARRLTLPQTFLAVDSILLLYLNVV